MHLWLAQKAPTAQKQCGNFSIKIISHMLHASTASSRRKGALMNIIVQFSVVVNNGLVVLVHWVNLSLKGKCEKLGKSFVKGPQKRGVDTNWKAFLLSSFPFISKRLINFPPELLGWIDVCGSGKNGFRLKGSPFVRKFPRKILAFQWKYVNGWYLCAVVN